MTQSNPPTKLKINYMTEGQLVVVRTFGSGPEADMAKGALEGAGIDAMIQADTAGGMRPHLAWAGSGFKVLIREEDVAAARDLLESSDQV
ncbi:MAG: putative signal transducing protein [Bryobacteraceae bacterium]